MKLFVFIIVTNEPLLVNKPVYKLTNDLYKVGC